MKHAIISDIHANLEAFEAVLARIDALIAADDEDWQVVCLGDVVGYNANPNECVTILRERRIPSLCGNHDAVACGIEEPWGFNPIAQSAAFWTRNQLSAENLDWLHELPDFQVFDTYAIAHGSPADRDTYLFTWEDTLPHFPLVRQHDRSLCFFGHTHCPGVFSADGMYALDEHARFTVTDEKVFFINPGSVGQPRDGDPRAAFGVYDDKSGIYELVRVAYPIEETARRIYDNGLPGFLAERLFVGR